jgi:hypothetical protein
MVDIAHAFSRHTASRLPVTPAGSAGPESQEPDRRPDFGAVRILRTDEELTEAIARARDFERHSAEVMRNRTERHERALHHSSAAGPDGNSGN